MSRPTYGETRFERAEERWQNHDSREDTAADDVLYELCMGLSWQIQELRNEIVRLQSATPEKES